jgi:hypothetical protein
MQCLYFNVYFLTSILVLYFQVQESHNSKKKETKPSMPEGVKILKLLLLINTAGFKVNVNSEI